MADIVSAMNIMDILDITAITGMMFVDQEVLYAIIPILLIGAYYLKKSTKKILVLSRMVVAALIIIALASPYTLTTHRITDAEPTITVIDDRSTSMEIFNATVADRVYGFIHDRNPSAQIKTFSGNQTPIGDKILQYARGNDHIVLVSDGNSNCGAGLADAVSVVSGTNTTVYLICQSPDHNDVSVEIVGSKNVIVGNKNTFRIVVQQAGAHVAYELTVKVDDEVIYRSEIEQFDRTKVLPITHAFSTLGTHIISASISPVGDDHFQSNNAFDKSVYVVPKPAILLITDEESNLMDTVSDLYDVTVSSSGSAVQDKYKAIIFDDRYIESMLPDDLDALRDFVSDGRGLVVVGGDRSYDRGDYLDSDFEKMLPVKSYPSEYYGRNDVVFVMDISASTFSEIVVDTGVTFLDYEKALVIDILDDRDFRDDRAGTVAFGGKAYEVSGLTYLGNDAARESLKETIMTIEPKGEITTTLDQGLAMAEEMLSNSAGAKDVIIISDGNIDAGIYESSRSVAARMNNADTRMHFIHVMSSPTNLVTKFEDLARGVDGTYQQTTYPRSVAISTAQPDADATPTPTPPPEEPGTYTVSTFTKKHFITRHLDISATITGYNDVTSKLGAKRLVVTGEGKPIVCAWRYGLGRVVSWSTDNGCEWSSALYTGNNSQLISSVANWAIGDPRSEEGIVIEADDVFLGDVCDLTIMSDTIPDMVFGGDALDISRIAENTYKTSIDLDAEGVYYLSDYGIAVNYPVEYLDVGMNPDVEKVIQLHGGRVYNESETDMLLSDVKRRSVRTTHAPVSQKTSFILAALALFLIEVIARRVREIARRKEKTG
ncbi:MAG: VWA domain-containing protein [Methanosarcinales archaeon]|nr:VWA domain-containing protein [Methanosarcinales archaeon]